MKTQIGGTMPLAKITIEGDGMGTMHNFPCPICRLKPAVHNVPADIFEPCWGCQKQGWALVKVTPPFKRWLLGLKVKITKAVQR